MKKENPPSPPNIDDAVAKVLLVACRTELASLEAVYRRAIAVGDSFRDRDLGVQVKQFVDSVVKSRRINESAPSSDQISLIEFLNDHGWRHSSEVLYIHFLPSLKSLDLCHLVKMAPTVRSLSALCKEVPVARREFEEIAVNDPRTAVESAIADWLFQNGKLEKTNALFSLMLCTVDRPLGLASPEHVLGVGVKRDKQAVLFRYVISQFQNDNTAQNRFARIVLQIPVVAIHYADVVRDQKLWKAHADGILAFIRALATAAIIETRHAGEIRKTASLTLIRILSGALLIQPDDKPQPMYVSSAERALQDLERAADTEEYQIRTWLAHPLKRQTHVVTSVLISEDAAKVLKIAFDNADQSVDVLQQLEAIAFNFGMTPMDTLGARVVYDPLRHEDTVGGLLPGDDVEVIRKGWLLNNTPVIRARVK